jgi:hypothetical protein
MAEEFDRGWYVRSNASPFTPTPPVFFAHGQTSEIERLLICAKPPEPNRP